MSLALHSFDLFTEHDVYFFDILFVIRQLSVLRNFRNGFVSGLIVFVHVVGVIEVVIIFCVVVNKFKPFNFAVNFGELFFQFFSASVKRENLAVLSNENHTGDSVNSIVIRNQKLFVVFVLFARNDCFSVKHLFPGNLVFFEECI